MYNIRVFVLAISIPGIITAMESTPSQSQTTSYDVAYWRDMLNNNPRKALQTVIETKVDWKQKSLSCDTVPTYETRSPIFLLDECIGACELCRKNAPRFRNTFETYVVNALEQQVSNSYQTLQYASFGSGDLFQDCVILTKFLSQHPSAQIHIHAIDPEYKPYMIARNMSYQPKPKDRNIPEYESMQSDITKIMTNNIIKNQTHISAQAKSCIKVNQQATQIRFQQFLRFLRSAFPKAQILLALHPSVDTYMSYINYRHIPYPDVIAAADININNEKTLIDYYKLCCLSQYNKSTSDNVLLTKNDVKKGIIVKLSCTPDKYKRVVPVSKDKFGVSHVWLYEHNIQ